jgi:hypothetical protein
MLGVAVAASTVALAGTALGAEPRGDEQAEPPHKEASAEDKETARSLVALGDERMAAKDYAAALKAYQGADAIMGVPTTGIEVARAQVALGLLAEARDLLLRVARFPKDPNEPEAFTKARETAQKLAESLAQRIPSLQVDVVGVSDTDSVEVLVDGERIPNATLGLPRKTNPGEHRISATAPGKPPLETVVRLEEREREVVTIDFARTATTTATHPAGPAASGEAQSVLPTVAYASFGVAGVGLLVGAITGGVSLSTASSVKDTCAGDVCPTSSQADADRALTLAHVSTVSLALGGAAALVGIIAVAMAASESPSTADKSATPRARVEPLVGPGVVGWF